MSGPAFVILGCGFTGVRVARRLLERGARVIATGRKPASLADLERAGAAAVELDVAQPAHRARLAAAVPEGARVLHSIPLFTLDDRLQDPTPVLLEALGRRPARMVYLSTTGVYGDRSQVDETTLPAPVLPRQTLRVAAEQAVAAGPWSSLILRPAGIYGPGRGVHIAMQEGRYKLVGDGRNYLSRIHVADLAAIAEAALETDLRGAWPVADDHPCPAREVAAFCAALLDLPMPPSVGPEEVSETLRFDRRIDGRAIRRALGVELAYPSYREGIPACLSEEAEGNVFPWSMP
jgi:nucleoside-diphosphate-sugar epimerase